MKCCCKNALGTFVNVDPVGTCSVLGCVGANTINSCWVLKMIRGVEEISLSLWSAFLF